MKTIKIIICITLISLININLIYADEFNNWLSSFKKHAMENGISKKTLDRTMSKVKFLPKVIEYDRYQPEFYEDTNTYINKRTSDTKLKKRKGIIYKKQLFNIEC